MTRFVTYDPEVAARLAQAVGMHRVELRDATQSASKRINPALEDAVGSPDHAAVFMPSSDEQVLLVKFESEDSSADDSHSEEPQVPKKRKKFSKQKSPQTDNLGSRPSGFLGLEDEVFSNDQEDPPRSLWKKDE